MALDPARLHSTPYFDFVPQVAAPRTMSVPRVDATAAETTFELPSPVGPYDPETEADELIRAQITCDEATGQAVFRAYDYPVWSVVLNLRATDYDYERVRRMFPELPLAAMHAAARFWRLHRDDIRERVE